MVKTWRSISIIASVLQVAIEHVNICIKSEDIIKGELLNYRF